MKNYTFQVVMERDEDGYFIADVPALAGCHSQGRTAEEALANVREVIELCVHESIEAGKEVDARYPEVISVQTIDVSL
jgi:predicted RNase H-like HicB family nuclease